MMRIAKEFTFDMAHMLDGHDGKCHHLHGHTYTLQVEVAGDLIANGSKAGMVLDYGDIKRIVKEHVTAKLDHAFAYFEENENECRIAKLLQEMDRKTVAFPCRTTAEGMAMVIFDWLAPYLPVSAIRLGETPTSFCEYRGEWA
ncbi:6-carboxytetrahydropterin synthase QueD [Listeria newyorkensis]|uniref:6-carboxy-5,6,7,8-tetrahydropterin synthase n=1 Tax=Listeria newyorkensis TaxID=1497681 RepID=A0A841YXG1_9LIST|nr:6-carboxytetrahydropterin synthase QueD [Listeria newyorkensis]MBC1457769.1 6-carboxytetrahydropterin synthase QueD [Listeria newyorkensis]